MSANTNPSISIDNGDDAEADVTVDFRERVPSYNQAMRQQEQRAIEMDAIHLDNGDADRNGDASKAKNEDEKVLEEILNSKKKKKTKGSVSEGEEGGEGGERGEGGDGNGKKGKKSSKEKPKTVPLTELLFRYATPLDKVFMVFGTIGAIAAGTALPYMTVIFGQMIDVFTLYAKGDISREDFLDGVLEYTLWFVGLALVDLVVCYVQMACWITAGERQSKQIRQRFFQSILRQDIGWFDTQKSGELTARIQGDTHLIQEAIGEKVSVFIMHSTTFFAGFIIGFVRGWKMTFVLIAVVPFLAACGAFFSKMLATFTTKGQNAYAKAGAVAEEVLSSIRTVVSFSGEEREVDRYSTNLEDALKTGIGKGHASGIGIGFTYFFMFCSYGLAFWFGSILIDRGEMTSGQVLNVFFAVIIGAFSLGHAGPAMAAFGAGMGAAYHVFGILNRVPEIDSLSDSGDKLSKVEGRIRFANVHFAYPSRPDVPILRGLDLDVSPGQTVALVGASGCGKSTVIGLLERFYNPHIGDVYLDGKSIKDLNVSWLRQQIGIVTQEPILFAMSIEDNIRMGKADATQEEIIAAAKNANIHSFIITLPEAYGTFVGERGAQLSGGQKQRIAIARALVKNPKILLLDEATSALDNESEKVVQEALDKASQGRTTIVIAHRLSTIRDADKIVVIEQGRMSQEGTHEQLIQRGGEYSDLVNAQKLHLLKHDGDASTDDPAAAADKLRVSAIGDSGRKISALSQHSASNNTGSAPSEAAAASEEEEAGPKTVVIPKEKQIPMSRVMALNRPELFFIIGGCIAATINGIVMPLFSILFAEILKVFTKTGEEMLEGARFWAGMFVVLAVATGLAYYFQTYLFGYAGEKLTFRLRQQSFQAMLRQEIGFFDNKTNATGALTARLAVDASLVQGMSGARLGSLAQVIVNLLGGIIIAFVSGWKLTLVILACVPLIMIAGALQMKIISGFSADGKTAYQKSGKIASEAIDNIRTVATLNKEEYFYDAFSAELEFPYKLGVRKAHVAGLGFGFANSMMFFTYALAYWYGGQQVADEEQTFEEMIRTFTAIVFCAMAAGQMSEFAPDAAKAKQAAYNIFELLDRKSKIDSSSPDGTRAPVNSSTVEFKNVKFRYPSREDVVVMDGFSLTVPAGKKVALVGASGCGKSTSIALLERFYDPIEGEILLDGQNIAAMNLAHLRSQLGLVSQEPMLFGTTIEENIRYGKPDATMDEIVNAARDANIHAFIMALPDAYKTEVGERGAQLSGGQKQRIAIARALLRNPQVLLLDEATSALDTESEKVVQEALDRASKGRTTIVIAHRLSTIQDADKIVVISNGKVAESGTHQELLYKKGLYAQLAAAKAASKN